MKLAIQQQVPIAPAHVSIVGNGEFLIVGGTDYHGGNHLSGIHLDRTSDDSGYTIAASPCVPAAADGPVRALATVPVDAGGIGTFISSSQKQKTSSASWHRVHRPPTIGDPSYSTIETLSTVELQLRDGVVIGVTPSPDGSALLTTTRGRVVAVDATTGTLLESVAVPRCSGMPLANPVRFPGDTSVVMSCRNTVVVVDCRSAYSEVAAWRWNPQETITSLCVNPDANSVLGVTDDGVVVVWDVRTQKKLDHSEQQPGALHCVGKFPGRDMFATGSSDGALTTWSPSRDTASFRYAPRRLLGEDVPPQPSLVSLDTAALRHPSFGAVPLVACVDEGRTVYVYAHDQGTEASVAGIPIEDDDDEEDVPAAAIGWHGDEQGRNSRVPFQL